MKKNKQKPNPKYVGSKFIPEEFGYHPKLPKNWGYVDGQPFGVKKNNGPVVKSLKNKIRFLRKEITALRDTNKFFAMENVVLRTIISDMKKSRPG